MAATLAACGGASSGPAMEHSIGLVYFAPEEGADSCMKGLFDGLKAEGIEERVNLEVRRSHAQGEFGNIPLLIQNYDGSDVDVIVAMTTPVLMAAASVARFKPVVFTYVYDPIAAGVGKSPTDHLPHVTGVSSFPPVQDTIETIQRLVPGVRAVGTLYNSSEANSVKVVGVARGLFQQRGIQLQEIAITGTSEISQAAPSAHLRYCPTTGLERAVATGSRTATIRKPRSSLLNSGWNSSRYIRPRRDVVAEYQDPPRVTRRPLASSSLRSSSRYGECQL